MRNLANPANPELLQPVAIHEQMPSGLEVVTIGTMGPGEHPIGAMTATDASHNPLENTVREQAVVDSWEAKGKDSPNSRLPKDHPEVTALEKDYAFEETEAGLLVPDAEAEGAVESEQNAEDESKKAPGFFTGFADRISSFVKKHPKLSKTVAGLGVAAAASGIFAETAKGYTWSHLGGDPLFEGGAKNEKEFIRNITSAKGKRALKLLGFNKRERGALIGAARRGEAESCRTKYGEHFDRMTYGLNGPSVVNDVTFADPRYRGKGAPAWCLEAELPKKGGGTVTVSIETPKKCSNFATGKKETTPPERPHKPPTGFVNVYKHALDANDNPLVPTPSGVFRFDASCVVKGLGRVHNIVTYNPDGRNRPVRVLDDCKVGSVAVVKELSTLGPDQWEMLTPVVQKQKVNRGKNLFTYKDRQVRPSQPGQPGPGPENHPPSVTIDSWDHIKTSDIQQICAYPSDADGDIVSRVFTEIGNGSFTTNPLYPDASPSNPYDPNPNNGIDEDCILYAAGSLGQTGATITETVRDSADQEAHATEEFDIDDGPRGEF